MSNEGTEQSERMRRLVWAFVVRKPLETDLLASMPILIDTSRIIGISALQQINCLYIDIYIYIGRAVAQW